ncbi:glycine zipper 2TM domain-containing protein [Cognatilysobacter lacus]|uniref:Glycine zipper 2TM domain-containing protein n=1 Tax=Cognatilysobacter lacus TaxID=1643323 RepID=A0A5D8YTW1_9GAMM|nr:glycine zipper 2TM domain-containing protein [Lysobacter lacus]TZF85362.1 glycine zipper 2TM domain-containing protein [Lysobacter lacus]
MKHLTATVLALALTAVAGTASAQYSSYPANNGYSNSGYSNRGYSSQGAFSDYARVVRVTPVYDSRGAYAAGTGGQRCTESRTYSGYSNSNGRYYDPNDRNGDGYPDNGYASNGYGSDAYGRDPYARDQYGYPRQATQGGSTAATVIGGIVGAVVGSQVGGGSARYATSAIGSMVGGIAGRQVYENAHRQTQYPPRVGRVVSCDPMTDNAYQSGRNVSMYDVTYEYGGRNYTTRTTYDPGSRIRVLVDVRPE